MAFAATDLPQLGKAFWTEATFKRRVGPRYALLPLRFLRLDTDRYICTSFAGEYVVLSTANLHSLVRHSLAPDAAIYNELKSKHFLMDGDSNVALDLLACKYRTKHSLLAQLTSLFLLSSRSGASTVARTARCPASPRIDKRMTCSGTMLSGQSTSFSRPRPRRSKSNFKAASRFLTLTWSAGSSIACMSGTR